MGSLKTARGSNEPFKRNLILAKIIFFLTILAEIKLRLNGSLDPRAVLSDPMAFDPIYLHKYFHIFIYFIHQVIAYFSKHAARAIATLRRTDTRRWMDTRRQTTVGRRLTVDNDGRQTMVRWSTVRRSTVDNQT